MRRFIRDIVGYFVSAILEVRLQAIPSQPQTVLVSVVAFSARATSMVFYPVYDVGLNFRLSVVGMVRCGEGYWFPSKQCRKFLELRWRRCFSSKVGPNVGKVD